MTVYPIISPIVALLSSRKVMVAVITGIIDILIAANPDLAPQRDALILAFTSLAGIIIGAIAHEDGRALSAGVHPAQVTAATADTPSPTGMADKQP